MDYGVHLKRTVGNANRRSPGYVRQSRFGGSVRQVRGAILKVLLPLRSGDYRPDQTELLGLVLQLPGLDAPEHALSLDDRFAVALQGLVHEGMVAESGGRYGVSG
jgi:A/G-specific adenine glycosylase